MPAFGDDFIMISNHANEYYNGNYYKSDKWNDYPHYEKVDRSAHLFYFKDTLNFYW